MSSIIEPKFGEYEGKARGIDGGPNEAALRCLGGCSEVLLNPGNAAAPGWKTGAFAGRADPEPGGMDMEAAMELLPNEGTWFGGDVVFRSAITR